MAEYFRITGLNNILFDQAAAAANNRYRCEQRQPPKGIDKPLTRQETLARLRELPQKIRSHVLSQQGEHLMSVITFPFNIQGTSDADMEDAEHDLRETLEATKIYFSTVGARGTEAELQVKSDGAAASSYKSIFYGVFSEEGGRQILGGSIKEHYIENLQMTLYCEPYWHPSSATQVVNAVNMYNHDDTDANHDNFVDITAANILGDVPGPTLVYAACPEFTEQPKWLYFVRRSTGTPSSFDHWLEAEGASGRTNWANAVDTSRSAGNIVSDSANATGEIYHSLPNLDHIKGTFNVYASLWTDDIVNTKLRVYIIFGSARTYTGSWKYLAVASRWQLINLGPLLIDPRMYPIGDTMSQCLVGVEYEKDAADTVKCDYLMILPTDESAMLVTVAYILWYSAGESNDLEVDGIRDFASAYQVLGSTGDFEDYAFVKGDWLTLQPRTDNRVYLKFLQAFTYTDPYNEHIDDINNNDGASADHLTVSIWHLPYYISPLE